MRKNNTMLEVSELVKLISMSDDETCGNHRFFQLQSGEMMQIRSNLNEQDYLYILKGEVKIDAHDSSVTLTEAESKSKSKSLNVFTMVGDEALVSVTAIENSVIYHVDGNRLDDILTWVEVANTLGNEPEKLKVLAKVLKTKSLISLPVESVYELISRMEIKSYEQGDVVIKQGDKADSFYILHKGKAEVWATGLYDDEPQLVNVLSEGDSFGEDALVMDGTRGATIKMQTDGVLLISEKKDFKDLVANPSIEEIDADVTQLLMCKDDYQLLDVRYSEEHEDIHIDGCELIPLHELRDRFSELDVDKKYITYCRSGKRSAVAALILKQRKYNVVSMRGGIKQWPFATKSLY